MKRVYRLALCLLAVLLLTIPVFADTGPKPQLIVRVENAPEELYYLDLVREGEPPHNGAIGGLEGSYTEEEIAALDQDLLAALTAAVPEGWYSCIVQGVLVWGNIDSEDGYHRFGYDVPNTCRILMVTKSGEIFLSEPFSRQALQSSATLDWAEKTVKIPPVFLGYAAQFLATFLPTLAIEGLLFLVFRLWSKRNGLVFLLTNLVTQGGLTLWMSLRTVRGGTYWVIMLKEFPYEYGLLPAELVIFLVEIGLYCQLFHNCSKKRAALYALAANFCSLLLGLYLVEPVWSLVVHTIL